MLAVCQPDAPEIVNWEPTSGIIDDNGIIKAVFSRDVLHADLAANYRVVYSGASGSVSISSISYNPDTFTTAFTMSVSGTDGSVFRIETLTGDNPITDGRTPLVNASSPAYRTPGKVSPPCSRFISYDKTTNYFLDCHGNPMIPVGHNDWFDIDKMKDPEYMRQTFSFLKQHSHENVYRLILDGVGNHVESSVGVMNPDFVTAMDNIISAAEEFEISLIIAVWPNVFETPVVGGWHVHPYNINVDPEHGLVSKRDELITNPKARQAQKNRMDYFIRRWGGSYAIFSWELWNEFNIYVDGNIDLQNDWIDDMGAFVKALELELYGDYHLRSVSTSTPNFDDSRSGIYSSPHLDFTSFHTYDTHSRIEPVFYEPAPIGRVNPVKYIQFIHNCYADYIAINTSDRPTLGTEDASIMRNDAKTFPWPVNQYWKDYTPEQRDDVFTGSSWISFMAGASGPNMRWSCNPVYGDEDEQGFRALSFGMYRSQKAMRTVLSDIPFTRRLKTNHHRISADDDPTIICKLLSCKNNEHNLIWLFDTDNDFDRKTTSGLTVTVSDFPGGNYTVTWYDIRTGEMIRRDSTPGSTMTVPDFQTFIAGTMMLCP